MVKGSIGEVSTKAGSTFYFAWQARSTPLPDFDSARANAPFLNITPLGFTSVTSSHDEMACNLVDKG